jgi:hypothetical protein
MGRIVGHNQSFVLENRIAIYPVTFYSINLTQGSFGILQEGSFDRLTANIQVICKRRLFEDSQEKGEKDYQRGA